MRSGWSWTGARTRGERCARARSGPGWAYIWLNLVEQRLRAVVAAVLRPIYEPVHGDDWVVAAAGPAGQEWVQRAVAVREVSRCKGYLLDPADDNVLSFLTLPQLRELMVQHWPCFEPYFDDRRDVELALDELEVTRNVVSRNRALSETVLNRPSGPPRGCWRCSARAATCPRRAGCRWTRSRTWSAIGTRTWSPCTRTGCGCCASSPPRTCSAGPGGSTRSASA
ncbi:hypothetical protein STENM223S_02338 [Streptomyces tendae]